MLWRLWFFRVSVTWYVVILQGCYMCGQWQPLILFSPSRLAPYYLLQGGYVTASVYLAEKNKTKQKFLHIWTSIKRQSWLLKEVVPFYWLLVIKPKILHAQSGNFSQSQVDFIDFYKLWLKHLWIYKKKKKKIFWKSFEEKKSRKTKVEKIGMPVHSLSRVCSMTVTHTSKMKKNRQVQYSE